MHRQSACCCVTGCDTRGPTTIKNSWYSAVADDLHALVWSCLWVLPITNAVGTGCWLPLAVLSQPGHCGMFVSRHEYSTRTVRINRPPPCSVASFRLTVQCTLQCTGPGTAVMQLCSTRNPSGARVLLVLNKTQETRP